MNQAERFEIEKERIIKSCFSKHDEDGLLCETYITHIRVLEDPEYPDSPPPLVSDETDNKKVGYLLVSVQESKQVQIHKGRENYDGSFSIGKSWPIDSLTRVETFDMVDDDASKAQLQAQRPGAKGFTLWLGKPYYWEADIVETKQFFLASLVNICTQPIVGKVPELVGFTKEGIDAMAKIPSRTWSRRQSIYTTAVPTPAGHNVWSNQTPRSRLRDPKSDVDLDPSPLVQKPGKLRPKLLSAGEVILLCQEAMINARALYDSEIAGSTESKVGLTLDLSHKGIQEIPEEVIDTINRVERLALSHNQINTLPSRFSECSSLRYLNIRNNRIRKFPLVICQMTSLEILDIARNKLTTLPPELVKLTSLKVMAVGKNRLETLPLYIADMAALQVLKLEANPIKFPPKEIFDVQQLHLDTHQPSDGDIDDIALTLRIKRFLRETQRHIAEGMETESSTSSLILPTDSGYVSFGKSKDVNFQNENEDVRSILTDNENIAFEPGTKQQLISAFTYEIFQSLGDFFNDKHESSMRVIDALPELLKDFSIELRDGAAPGVQQNTAVFVRHHRTHIARSFQKYMEAFVLDVDDAGGNPGDGLTLDEKMSLWYIEEPNTPDEEPAFPEELSKYLEDLVDDSAIPYFEEARPFIVESKAYNHLLGKIRALLDITTTKGTIMDSIRTKILFETEIHRKTLSNSLSSPHLTISLNISWDPIAFFKTQFQGEECPLLQDIITLTGGGVNAQGATCAQYMQQTWPASGMQTLRVLSEATLAKISRPDLSQPYKSKLSNSVDIQISLSESVISVEMYGPGHLLAEIGQQLAWVGAACRVSPHENRINLCSTRFAVLSRSLLARGLPQVRCELNYSLHDIGLRSGDQRSICWHALFRNPVIVEGFPTANRLNGERGLEIPLPMMASLGLVERATIFDGALVLKGFCSMFVPTKRSKDSIQWHFVRSGDGTRISYLEADNVCPERLKSDSVDTNCLEYVRNFVGWVSSAALRTGTENINYENINWTGSNFSSAGCAFGTVSISGGKIINAGFTFAKGNKDTPVYLSHASTYFLEMHYARGINVVLYDIQDRRGWLVDGSSALLHITRTQLSSQPFINSTLFKISDFHHANSADGMNASHNALIDYHNLNLVLFEETETWEEVTESGTTKTSEIKSKKKKWCFRQLVQQTWHILEQIHDHQTKLLAAPGINLRGTDRDKLEGFGFKDIVEGENPLRPRVAILKSSGKGWVDFTRNIDAITLLGRGFGEIIKPVGDFNTLCRSWQQVPIGQDYLVAPISLLEKICVKRGNVDANPLELAQNIYWHKGSKLFEPCSDCKPNKWGATCDRVQVLLPPSLGHKIQPNPFGMTNGAVVFGRSARYNWQWKNKGEPTKGIRNDEDLEEDLVHDSGIGTSIGSENVSAGTLGTATPLQVSMKPSGPSQRGSSIENAAPGSDAVETILGNDVVVVANEAGCSERTATSEMTQPVQANSSKSTLNRRSNLKDFWKVSKGTLGKWRIHRG